MLSPSDTAYPLLKESPTGRELQELFTPNLFELGFAGENTRQPIPRLGLLLLLKSFQKLGYFVRVAEIPPPIVLHIAKTIGWNQIPDGLSAYDASTARFRHMDLVRFYLGVTPFADTARKLMLRTSLASSRVREDLADIVNMAIEELIRQRYELPGFSTLFRAARAARVTVNRGYYRQIYQATDSVTRAHIDALFEKGSAERRSSWDRLKSEPGQPTVKRIRAFLVHLDWLREQVASTNPLTGIPAVKLHRFAAEARVLNVARMKELTEEKRFALAAALLFRQLAQAHDDGADMLIRQVQRIHHRAKELMKLRQASHLQQSAELVSTLRDVTIAYQQEGTAEQRLQNIGAFLGSDPTHLLERCEEYAALASGIYLQLLPRFFRHPRNALLLLLEHIPLSSTSRDRSLEKAIAFILAHQNARSDWISVDNQGSSRADDWSFIGEQWWSLVADTGNRTILPTRVHHRYLELCVISQVANELKSGDLCSPLGDKFRDYRQQLIPWDQFEREVSVYGDQTGIPTEAKRFVQSLQEMLISTSRNTDERFPQNESVRIENGEPILSPLGAKYEPEDLKLVETWIKERMEHVEIIDALVDTEHWLHWTRYFGPLSGHDAKVDRLRERYVLTVFCYGCNLGPTQTARSIKDLDRFKLAFVNQRHITEANLNEAIATVVNTYVQFPLQRLWGLGHSASADGMKWDLYPQTLMSEYHIRYGGYGGIGYYLVSDNYIALMSRFTTCGSWEGHYILDFLQENKSEVQPDTIHADTQGQSTAIFGLAYLLGIELMPRIRNWKDQHLFRPAPDVSYEHIDELFTAQVDWDLIATLVPDMMRVAVSIRTGNILPSDILRRLNSSSRKNKLYFGFRELGRVVRTIFLLRYLSDAELRRTIQAATNKSERFNQFVQWVSFGGDSVIAENTRDEQRKFIKYNHLVANLLVFHNIVTLSRALNRLQSDDLKASDQALAALTPYQTEHINRFGNYTVNFSRTPEPLPPALCKSAGSENKGRPSFD